MKDGMVLVVVFLFLGVAVAPGINGITSLEQREDDYVEYTTEVCGLPGLQPQTVKLTRQQADEVEDLFDSIKSMLNNATMKEEAVVIFKDAVVELDKNGLLPKGMNIGTAQRLVTDITYYDETRFINPHTSIFQYGTIENIKCSVFAQGTGLDTSLPTFLYILLVNKLSNGYYPIPLIFLLPGIMMILFNTLNPIHLLYIAFLDPESTLYSISFLPLKYYIGHDQHALIGFTGLKLSFPTKMYYLGRAVFVYKPNI